jgi:hypothetical protein
VRGLAPIDFINIQVGQRIEKSGKVGRNMPCPCASGRKDKKIVVRTHRARNRTSFGKIETEPNLIISISANGD